ncbi:hypothetical protein [Streptomyces capillispiralis]|nr:hypothetical protein [Streptomyces capillispiralis]
MVSPGSCGRPCAPRAPSINEADADHDAVHWLTPVTDEEYAAAPATG